MSDVVVDTKYGKVSGKRENGVCVWKGIPFAKPPVGRLRFRRPEPPEPWVGIREALEYSLAAPQPPFGSFKNVLPVNEKGQSMSEDCLYLNIWSPAADGGRRPVMVWIHGGYYNIGSGTLRRYEGTSFAKNGDVVFVTINYRLGVLGFLQVDEMAGSEYESSGVCGILDQIAALRWVRENIAAFGGDPEQVTVFGQSAGSGSVSCLLAMPEAKGLFQRAILMSWSTDSTKPKEQGVRTLHDLLRELGLGVNDFDKLLDLPFEKLVEAGWKLPMLSFRPVENASLPEPPLQALRRGVSAHIPVMAGATMEEYFFTAFLNPIFRQPDRQAIIDYFKPSVGPFWDEIAPYYLDRPDMTDDEFVLQMKRLISFQRYMYSTIRLADVLAARPAPTWFYRFDYQAPNYGAGHGVEVPFVFNTLHLPEVEEYTGTGPERQLLADQMHRTWIAFARNASPDNDAIPRWPVYDSKERNTMLFHLESRVAHDPNREERELFRKAEEKLGIPHRPLWDGAMAAM